MTRPSRAIRDKVPPRAVYLAIWECGAFRCRRTAEAARDELAQHSDTCCARGNHAGRVVTYRRGSLYGRGKATWNPRVIQGGSHAAGRSP